MYGNECLGCSANCISDFGPDSEGIPIKDNACYYDEDTMFCYRC